MDEDERPPGVEDGRMMAEGELFQSAESGYGERPLCEARVLYSEESGELKLEGENTELEGVVPFEMPLAG